ncbi:beta-N-acetylglucosaminidase [Pedobacter yulinensis]|uniref:Beta-N-acetylglucosaminidase n=1 Tax=Pedobacter yulinensis TaxID=2126353 RepID=A0A2T3HP47_9SPHI|nr:serine hydrolase [Pedobacter yulinensis]PST84173.1 beta-N-acetylglucosaminidase [Pedobacter yulinensis]
MRKSNLAALLGLGLACTIAAGACAQDHSKNEKRFAEMKRISSATVLLNNDSKTVPIVVLKDNRIASVSLMFAHRQTFDSLMNKYAKVDAFSADLYRDSANLNTLEDDLKFYQTVVVSLNDSLATTGKYLNFIQNLSQTKKVIVALFGGNGRALAAFDNFRAPLIWSPMNNSEAASVVPQLIFGGMPATQRLKTGFSARYTAGSGFSTEKIRLSYTVPEAVGINSNSLREIDNIAAEAIAQRAAPGMVVLAVKDGQVIFNKAYGTHTYDTNVPDRVTDIFDLASVTKVTATTPSVMRLVEQGKLNLDTNIGAYIPRARATPMNAIPVREVMLHQAGFIPYIPFHNAIKAGDYSSDSSALYPTKVADNYYIRKGFFRDYMWPKMLNSPIKTRGKYVYSDISMYVMKDIVEHLAEQPLDQYTQENFYTPLGMQTAGFLPRNRFAREKIVPTENDTYFRKTLLQGYVHDQGAGLVGGVSGHAGLFSSANDLAIIYQMLLNRGSYGGTRYFKPETVDMFTQKQSDVSRRGLGFDRWDPDQTKNYPSELSSPQTYGHTGYTGTCVWVDPAKGLVYVFLSNRVNPTVTDKLINMRIRGRIQDVLLKAIK